MKINNKKRQDSIFKMRTVAQFFHSSNQYPDQEFYVDNQLYITIKRQRQFGKYYVVEAQRCFKSDDWENSEYFFNYKKSKIIKRAPRD